jgi:hypothetical protein
MSFLALRTAGAGELAGEDAQAGALLVQVVGDDEHV